MLLFGRAAANQVTVAVMLTTVACLCRTLYTSDPDRRVESSQTNDMELQ